MPIATIAPTNKNTDNNMQTPDQRPRLGLIGFGEVGQIFAADLHASNAFQHISAWDIEFTAQPENHLLRRCLQLRVTPCRSSADLVQQSDLIISAVTAANTLAVAKQLAKSVRANQVVLDLNSASPGTKQSASALIEARGAHYVEAGVMTSVPPYRIRVPMMLGGLQANTLGGFLNQLGMNTQVASPNIGVASAIKMCRSIMVKGLEALVIESFTTARSYGVEQEVIASLTETFPHIDWPLQGAYFFSRVVQHGKRRAEEMRESARTVADTQMQPIMASAIAARHDAIAQKARSGAFKGVNAKRWHEFADALILAQKK
jgi:3-hydroxyisobutyrate dehydrogenase-like beta-hydroxyacid dehydrogenase